MTEDKKKTIAEELLERTLAPMSDALFGVGITKKYLAEKLKCEINAKIKKAINWPVRQKARQDAHKLLNHYPAEKIKHDLGETGDALTNLMNEIAQQGQNKPGGDDD